MKSLKKRITGVALAAGLVGASLLIAPAAHAADGYCGYYSATHADNSKSLCNIKKVNSYVKVNNKYVYGPWAVTGKSSWQAVCYANVQAYSYQFRAA